MWELLNLLSFFPAFNKMVNVKGQDFNLQLVDTAGQVSYLIVIVADVLIRVLYS